MNMNLIMVEYIHTLLISLRTILKKYGRDKDYLLPGVVGFDGGYGLTRKVKDYIYSLILDGTFDKLIENKKENKMNKIETIMKVGVQKYIEEHVDEEIEQVNEAATKKEYARYMDSEIRQRTVLYYQVTAT